MGFKKLFDMTSPTEYRWEITVGDGNKHTICCSVPQPNLRQPIDVFIDGAFVKTLEYHGKTPWLSRTHEIKCEGETLLLVACGNRVDLVQKGRMLNTKIKYDTTQELSKIHRIAVSALSVLSLVPAVLLVFAYDPLFAVMMFMMGTVVSLTCGVLFMQMLCISPFYTKEQKKRKTALVVLGVWALNLFVAACVGPLMQILLS